MEYLKLKELFTIKKGNKVEQVEEFEEAENLLRYIQIDDLRNDKNKKYCYYNSKYIIAKEEDLIIAWDGANAGTIGYGLNGAIGSTLSLLKLNNSEFNTKYCGMFLKSKFKYLRDNCTGATIPHISRSSLEDLKIPKLTLENQNKIVEVLDKAQELIDKRKGQIEALDELVKSRFIEMFGTPMEKRFIGKTLPEIIAADKYALKRGPFGGSLKKDDFIQEGYLVYEQRHAIHNDFDYAKYYISKDKYDEMIMFKVDPKDLLVSCSGVTLGRISEVPDGAKEGIINQALLKITLNQNIMNNIYFMQLFRNEQIQDKLFGFSRGSGIPNFPSMNEVKAMEFLCPPIELQNQFADFVKRVDKLKFKMEKSLKELEDNFNSLMQKAFKGELFKED